jgi:hypothetical protein
MAQFTGSPASSVQYAAQHSVNRAYGAIGALWVARFNYVHTAGAGFGEINLVKLPPGRIVIYSDLSRFVVSDMFLNADFHLGYRAHKKEDWTPVPEVNNAFADNEDAGTGPLDKTFPLPASGTVELDSEAGITLFAMIDAGNIENTDTIDGYVVFSRVV